MRSVKTHLGINLHMPGIESEARHRVNRTAESTRLSLSFSLLLCTVRILQAKVTRSGVTLVAQLPATSLTLLGSANHIELVSLPQAKYDGMYLQEDPTCF